VPVGGIETVFNAAPAEGGADGETLTALLTRGPATIRHRGRAVTADDYAVLAREASPSVAVAQVLGGRDPSGLPVPGWVTLVIIPQSAEPRPYPSFGLREDVRRFIAERAPADVTAAGQIEVTGPDYVPIDVSATVVPRDPTEAGVVEQAVRQAIAGFLHPLHGGPAGRGWQAGQGLWLSDLAPLLERADGVDHVTDVELLRGGQIQGDHVALAGQQIPVAGNIHLRLVAG
jgi:predicted phage baseplate assembly protein